MSTNPIPTRVRYYDRQFLQAADLNADQLYHRQMRWRHNLSLHSWGILAGLEVQPPEGDVSDTVTVTAGMALDGYGRELVLSQNVVHRQKLNRDQAYDIWLIYHEEITTQTDSRNRCSASADASRYQEKPQVVVTLTSQRQSPDPARPNAVPTGDLDFSPERMPPDDGRPWPVFLGRLDNRDAGGTRAWQVDSRERRYAGLIAERVVARHGEGIHTVVIAGKEPLLPDSVFAVASLTSKTNGDTNPEIQPVISVRAEEKQAESANREKSEAADRKTTRSKYAIELTADRVTATGDIALMDGAVVEFRANGVPASLKDNPYETELVGSEHWRMYHHFEAPPVEEKKNEADAKPKAKAFKDELRITMPNSPVGENSVAIGCFGEKGKFEPILVVKNNKTVEVHGTLKVEGKFEGTQAEVPANTTGSGSGAKKKDQFNNFCRERNISSAEILEFLSESETNYATLVTAHKTDDIATGLWQKPNILAKTAGNANFTPFVANLGTQPLNELMKVVVPKVMDATVPARATLLAQSFPTANNDDALVAFAKELVKDSAKLAALIAVLNDAGPKATAKPFADALLSWPHEIPPGSPVGTPKTIPTALATERMYQVLRLLTTDLTTTPLHELDPLLVARPQPQPSTLTFEILNEPLANITKEAKLRALLRYARNNSTLPPTDLTLYAKYFLQAVQVLEANIGDKL